MLQAQLSHMHPELPADLLKTYSRGRTFLRYEHLYWVADWCKIIEDRIPNHDSESVVFGNVAKQNDFYFRMRYLNFIRKEIISEERLERREAAARKAREAAAALSEGASSSAPRPPPIPPSSASAARRNRRKTKDYQKK